MSTYEYETGEMELGSAGEMEFGEAEQEFGQAGETSEQEQFLGDVLGGVLGGEMESPLSEAQEMELAGELLGVSNEQELEQFLGNIFKGVANAVGGAIKSPIGQVLGGVLKDVAKTALPVVGGALGSYVAPGIGTAIGSRLGSMAGGLFEMEGEAASPEQSEFEVARQVVRLSASAAQKAATAPAHLPPNQVARTAVVQAARQVVPGAPRMHTRGGGARGAATYGQGRPFAPISPEQRRQLASLPPSARLAAGFGAARAGRPGAGAGPQRYRRPRYAAPGYWTGGWDGGVDEPFDVSQDNGDGVSYGVGGAQRTGRWVRRGRKIILLGV